MKVIKKLFIYFIVIQMIIAIFAIKSNAIEYSTSSYSISTGNSKSAYSKSTTSSASVKIIDNDDKTEVEDNKNMQENIDNSKLPVFYGTTNITSRLNEEIDLDSTLYRIFAKDYLGRDITNNIKLVENNINIQKMGNYVVKYEVTDSEGNISKITVPVNITQNEKKIQRTLYKQEDTSHINVTSCYRGDNQDSQILGIYLENGKKVNARVVNNNINAEIEGYYATINGNMERFTINKEGTTILKSDYNSIPLIKSYKIKKTYKNIDNESYSSVYDLPEGTMYFANVFDRTTTKTEKLNQIKIPVYGCTSYKIYVNSKDGELNFSNDNLVYVENNNTVAGYASIGLNDIELSGDKFAVAVEYTGTKIPCGQNNFTYKAESINGEWKQGIANIPPIIVNTSDETNDQVVIELDLSDNCKELNYYRLGDGLEKQNEFLNLSDDYSILDSERMMMLVPKKDFSRIIVNNSNDWNNFYNEVKNSFSMYYNENDISGYFFKSFDEILTYYNDIINSYDKYVGLSLNSTEHYNKNVLTKFFIRPNINGSGLAYYSDSSEIGNTADTLGLFMYKSWGALHEIGHGYESNWYGRYSDETDTKEGNINLTEVANNVLAYVYEKNILLDQSNSWLLSTGNGVYCRKWTYSDLDYTLENLSKNNNYTYFDDIMKSDTQGYADDLHFKLYYILKLMNLIESDNTNVLTTLYKNYRQEKSSINNQTYTPTDRLARAIYQATGSNKIDTMEKYNLIVSDDVKKELNKNYSKNNIKGDINLDGKIASNDILELKKYINGTKKLYNQSLKNADYNGDGTVDENDLRLLKAQMLYSNIE